MCNRTLVCDLGKTQDTWRSQAMSFPLVLIFWRARLAKHRSRTQSRRAVLLTYNPSSEGDFHHAYYEEKARVFREVCMGLSL